MVAPIQILDHGMHHRMLIWMGTWLTMIVLLLFIASSDASCTPPLKCVSAHNCSLLLGNRTNLYTIFPCGYENRRVCCPPQEHAAPSRLSTADKMLLLPLDICGVSTDNRIIGGENAGPGQFPWMALLGYKVNTSETIQFLCGGSVISDRYILTAAHCLKLEVEKLVSVRLGELNLTSDPDCEKFCNATHCEPVCSDPVQNYEVEKVIVHDLFNATYLKNDIALIRLKRNITSFLGEYIRPLCLPFGLNFTGNEDIKYKVAGWGKTDHYNTAGSPVLQHATIQSVPLDDCNSLQAEEVRPLDSTQLCAGNTRGRDACKGDSGGPLMYIQNTTGKLFQAGVVSFGSVPCGGRDAPSVYTRVMTFLDWILNNLEA